MSDFDDAPAASSEAGIAAAFFCALYEDRAAGRVVSLAEYQARFPGFEALLEREYAAFVAEEEAEAAETPQTLGRYRLLRSLGRGGQGEVWLAEDPRLKRRVALKLLHAWSTASPQAFARFRREAEIASRLDHPGICTVYESGIEQGLPYFAMRYVEGESLAERIAAQRARWNRERDRNSSSTPTSRAELPQLLACLEQAARAMHVAHEAGIIHRDLKPANIVVTADGQPVLLDFGLARDLQNDSASLTHSGDIFGTPDYMAAEQVAGRVADIGPRTDVYALGVTLFECLTLRRPFHGATREALYHAILHAAPPRLRKLLPHAPSDLEVIVHTALEKEPARRYHSALEFAADLERLRLGQPIRARRAGPLRRITRWAQREPLSAALLSIVFLACAAGGYLLADWLTVRNELAAARRAEDASAIEALLEEGFAALGEDDSERARENFERVLQRSEDPHQAVIGMILLHVYDKQLREARQLLEQHRVLFETHPELAWAEAELLREEGREAEAQEVEASLAVKPTALSFFLRGMREIQFGHAGDQAAFARAQAHLESCILLSGVARPLYHQQFAHAVGHGEDEQLRRRTAETLITLWPDSGMAWYWAAFLHARIDWPTTVRYYEAALVRRAHDERAWTNLGNAHRALGQLEQAVQAHRQALQVRPRYPHAWFNLGNAELALEHWDVAEQCYREVIAIQPDFPHAHSQLSHLLFRRGEFEQAARAIQAEVERDPDQDDAWATWGKTLRRAKQFEEAARVLEDGLRRHPNSVDCWIQLGFTRTDRKDTAGAFQAFARVLEIAPENAIAYRQLGSLLLDAKRYEEAATRLERAVELDPEARSGWFLWSRAEMQRGNLEHALLLIRKAQVLDPEDLFLQRTMAYYLQLLERHEENAALLSRLLERAPDDYIRRCMHGEALLRLGRIEEALSELSRGGEGAKAARDRSFPWEAWLSEARTAAAQLSTDLEGSKSNAELPSDEIRTRILAEAASLAGDWKLALRAFDTCLQRTSPHEQSIRLGLYARAARCAASLEDNRALDWLRADLDHLEQRGDVRQALDLQSIAAEWRRDPLFARLFESAAGAALRERLDAWLSPR